MDDLEQGIPAYRYARYAALGVPLAFASLPLYVHVPALYAAASPLDLATIGFILLAVRSLDMVADPLIGSLSDAFQRHRGAIMAMAAPIPRLAPVISAHLPASGCCFSGSDGFIGLSEEKFCATAV